MRYAVYDTQEKKVVGMVGEQTVRTDDAVFLNYYGDAVCRPDDPLECPEDYRHTIHPMPDDTLQQEIDTGRAVLAVVPDGKELNPSGPHFGTGGAGGRCVHWGTHLIPTPFAEPEPELTKEDVLERLYAELERSKTFGGSNDRRAELQQMIRKVQEKHND